MDTSSLVDIQGAFKMIEDKETGIKIAESDKESFWEDKRQLSETMIKELEKGMLDIPKTIAFHKEIMLMCKRKIKELERGYKK